jgi:predicted nucleic acid-binding protein
VATRPSEANGLGLDRAAAIENVQALRHRVLILNEDQRVAVKLLELLADVACAGRQIHDANVVATMLVHGIETIVTSNLSDFRRFAGQITVLGLA